MFKESKIDSKQILLGIHEKGMPNAETMRKMIMEAGILLYSADFDFLHPEVHADTLKIVHKSVLITREACQLCFAMSEDEAVGHTEVLDHVLRRLMGEPVDPTEAELSRVAGVPVVNSFTKAQEIWSLKCDLEAVKRCMRDLFDIVNLECKKRMQTAA